MSATPGMPEYGGLADRIKNLEAQVAKLNRARRLQSASIGSGGLTVKDGGVIRFEDANGDVTTALSASGLDETTTQQAAGWVAQEFNEETLAFPTTETDLVTVTFEPPDWVETLVIHAFGVFRFSDLDEAPASSFFRSWFALLRINGNDSPSALFNHGSTATGSGSEVIRVAGPIVYSLTINSPPSPVSVSLRGEASTQPSLQSPQSLSALAFGSA